MPPPYVLVGHSLGGAYARRYAQLYPGEVAGLLFLEPFYEGFAAQSPKRTIGGMLAAMGIDPFMAAVMPEGQLPRAEQPRACALRAGPPIRQERWVGPLQAGIQAPGRTGARLTGRSA